MSLAAAFEDATERPLRLGAEVLLHAALWGCAAVPGGGVPAWLTGFWLLAAGSLVLGWADALRRGHRPPVGLAAGALLAHAAVVALQLVPLPPSVLGALSPATADLLGFVLGTRDQPLGAHPLTLDVPATARWLAQATGLAVLALAASQVARDRPAQRRLIWGVAALGLVLGGLALLHRAFDLTTLFGAPGNPRVGWVTPYVNRNHLASVLTLAALCQLGAAFHGRQRGTQVAWALAFVTTAGLVILSGSRAGALCLFAGVGMFAALIGRKGTGEARERSVRAGLAVALVLASLALGALLNAEFLLGLVGSLDQEVRVNQTLPHLWRDALGLIQAHPWTGIGRGTFEVAFLHHQTLSPGYTFTHPENIVVQWTSELGVPLGLGLLIWTAGAWVEATRKELGALEVGALAALFGVGLHELADFGLEFLGVGGPAVALFMAAETAQATRGRLTAWRAALLGAGLAAGGAWGMLHQTPSIAEARAAARAVLASGQPAPAVLQVLKPLIDAHPVDPELDLQAAVAWLQARPPQPGTALGWANRAMYLEPQQSTPHRVAATALLGLGARPQALLELRLAFPLVVNDGSWAAELRSRLHGPAEWLEVVSPDLDGALFAVDVLRDPDAAQAAQVGTEALKRLGREEPALLQRLAGLELRLGHPDAAVAYARRGAAAAPAQTWPLVLEARIAAQGPHPDDAEALLAQALQRAPGDLETHLLQAQLRLTLHDPEGAEKALAGAVPTSPDQKLQLLDQKVSVLAQGGKAGRALQAMREAAIIDASNPERRFALAEQLERMGRSTEAMQMWSAGLGLHPSPARRAEIEARQNKLRNQQDEARRARLLGPATSPDPAAPEPE
jgi:tetratricopeptide (TPR) repeat protein/O-antigen ligase